MNLALEKTQNLDRKNKHGKNLLDRGDSDIDSENK
jgi:hypothetical protein